MAGDGAACKACATLPDEDPLRIMWPAPVAADEWARDDRIREYHVVNANPVLGLEEGAWVMVDDASVTAHGTARVKLFRPAADPVWYQAGDRLPVT